MTSSTETDSRSLTVAGKASTRRVGGQSPGRAGQDRRATGKRADSTRHGQTIAATLTTEPFSSRDC